MEGEGILHPVCHAKTSIPSGSQHQEQQPIHTPPRTNQGCALTVVRFLSVPRKTHSQIRPGVLLHGRARQASRSLLLAFGRPVGEFVKTFCVRGRRQDGVEYNKKIRKSRNLHTFKTGLWGIVKVSIQSRIYVPRSIMGLALSKNTYKL